MLNGADSISADEIPLQLSPSDLFHHTKNALKDWLLSSPDFVSSSGSRHSGCSVSIVPLLPPEAGRGHYMYGSFALPPQVPESRFSVCLFVFSLQPPDRLPEEMTPDRLK